MIPGHLDTPYLKSQVDLLAAKLVEAGYEVAQGGFPKCQPDFPLVVPGSGARLLVHATFEAGGIRDVVVELLSHHQFRIFVGPMYDIAPGLSRGDGEPPVCQFWFGGSLPRPDLVQVVLTKARSLVLGDSYHPDPE